ncbi:MAG: adenylosuccinate lyase, partial [Candidatus Dadabacteria bacterium]|nr:adenylosuccinate lyase [Candidatus Dadabacteria bacterium]
EKGLSREDAYRLVQENAMRTWKGEGDFKELLSGDKAVSAALTPGELDECFDETADLKNVDRIFERVFS